MFFIAFELQTVTAAPIAKFFAVWRCKDTGDGIRVDKDEWVQQIVAAVLLKSLGQESSAQLKVGQPLM